MKPRWTAYQRRLIWFLSVATFFEGYDMFALAQILPSVRADFGLGPRGAGLMLGVVNVGTILAALLVRRADRWGRRRVLSVTIAGYTVTSLLSAAAPEALSFTLLQLASRIFLIGEWAIAMVYAAEEFPAAQRGLVLGIIQAMSALGGIVCAGLVPLLVRSPIGWRAVFCVGAVPLVLVALVRRTLPESTRFSQLGVEQRGSSSLLTLLRGPYRGRLFVVGAAWALTYVCTQAAITFWKEFALAERGLTDRQVASALTLAAVGSLPPAFFVGRLLDAVGRRRGAVLIYASTVVGVVGAYQLEGRAALTFALLIAIFGTTAVLPVLNAFTAELFPTQMRSDAFAWANNFLGRVGYVVAPLVVGLAAERTGWGPAVTVTALAPLVALALILWRLPETSGRELEETSLLH